MPITQTTRSPHVAAQKARPWHHRALKIVAPPLSHTLHGTYEGWHWIHLLIDTMLAVIILVLVSVNAGTVQYEQQLEPAPVSLAITAPPYHAATESLDVHMAVTNNGQRTVDKVMLTVNLPSYFLLRASVPAVRPSGDAWDLGSLDAGQTKSIIVHGVIGAERNDEELIRATVRYRDEKKFSERQATLALATLAAANVTFRADGYYENLAGVQLGYGPLPPRVGQATGYRVVWSLAADQAIREAVVSAQLPGDGITWQGNESVTGGQGIVYDPAKRTITWQIGVLESTSGEITASFDVAITPNRTQIGQSPELVGATQLIYQDAQGVMNDRRTDPITTRLSPSQPSEQTKIQP